MDPVEGPQNAASERVLWMEGGRSSTGAGFQALLLQLGPMEMSISESLISRSHFVRSHPTVLGGNAVGFGSKAKPAYALTGAGVVLSL